MGDLRELRFLYPRKIKSLFQDMLEIAQLFAGLSLIFAPLREHATLNKLDFEVN